MNTARTRHTGFTVSFALYWLYDRAEYLRSYSHSKVVLVDCISRGYCLESTLYGTGFVV